MSQLISHSSNPPLCSTAIVVFTFDAKSQAGLSQTLLLSAVSHLVVCTHETGMCSWAGLAATLMPFPFERV